MPRKELVVAASEGLPHPAELGSLKASSRGGPVSSLVPDVRRDPLCRLSRSGFGSDSCHVRQGHIVRVSLRYLLHWILAGGRTLCISVCHLVAGCPAVRRDPPNGGVVVSLRMREQTSMAATAKRWLGPRASSLTRLMAEVKSTNTVYWWSLSYRWSRALSAW